MGDPAIYAVDTSPLKLTLIVAAAALGSAINSIAGGGTLLTFPALVGLGVPAIVANATSTVALWPGLLGSMWGYRGELTGAAQWAAQWGVPSALGGLVGALLLLRTPADRFDAIVPWLVLSATALFLAQRPVMRWLRERAARAKAAVIDASGRPAIAHADPAPAAGLSDDAALRTPALGVLVYQFLVAIYGGYFGAGIGILMLAALGFMGFTNIHRMNGLKNFGALCINAVAAITFALSSLVNWPVAAAMALGALAGGYGASRLAQRVPQARVRQAIVLIGFASGIWLLAQRL